MELCIWDLYHALDHDDMFPMVQAGTPTIRFARLISSSHLSDEAVYVCDAHEFFFIKVKINRLPAVDEDGTFFVEPRTADQM